MTGFSQPTRRVLIVDDAGAVRADLHTILALTGEVEVVGEAANGTEAVQQAIALQPDVVLMDLEMPALDGYEATRQIKTSLPACRVIALTVYDYAASRSKAFQAGVDDFLVKGVSLETLLASIASRQTDSQHPETPSPEDRTKPDHHTSDGQGGSNFRRHQ